MKDIYNIEKIFGLMGLIFSLGLLIVSISFIKDIDIKENRVISTQTIEVENPDFQETEEETEEKSVFRIENLGITEIFWVVFCSIITSYLVFNICYNRFSLNNFGNVNGDIDNYRKHL